MKILVVSQHYFPEPVRLPDICEELVKRGHEVDVITGVPNYPMGYIYEGYGWGKRKDEKINGVNIHRSFTIGRRHGFILRVLNYYSFAYASSVYASRVKKKYDVVFVNQTSPVMMACAGVKYKKKHGTKLVYYTLDIWPECLIAGGVKRGSFVYRLFDKISRRLYQRADRILVTSKNFTTYLKSQHGIAEDKLYHLPQYAEDLFKPEEPVKKDTIELTFAGNVGAMQSVETIISAAAELKDIPNLRFNIVGDGTSLENCKKHAAQLGVEERIVFHGRRPLEEMPAFYKKADAMLVTLAKDPLISLTLPGKVQTYMAAGKAIIGAIDGEASEIIKEAACGLCGPSEDPHALAENIRTFIKSDYRIYGENAAKYYRDNFTKEKFIDTLIAELN